MQQPPQLPAGAATADAPRPAATRKRRRRRGAAAGRRVGFLVAGAQKGGTTALHAYLAGHPAICMARGKEVHFFDNEKRFRGGKPDYAAYHRHFAPKVAGQLLGETTPIYMYWYAAPRRIWEYNPKMKLLIILRNPIERAHSHWNMERVRGKEPLSFAEAVRKEARRCRKALPLQHRLYSYVDRGFYSEQLRRLWFWFPREQTLVLRNEALRADPAATLDRVWDFLGVERQAPARAREEHANPYSGGLEKAEWGLLRDIYEFEIRALERMLGWDCSDWLRPPSS
jgi:hypothetical protein